MPKSTEHALVRVPLALLALASAVAGQYSLAVTNDFGRAQLGWAVAVAAFTMLYFLDRAGRELPATGESLPRHIEWPLALAVLAVGVFYRTFRLSELPPGLNHDVAWNGLYAIEILHGIRYTPYVAAAWGRETLMFYLQALSIKWFGLELFAMVLPAVVAMIVILPLFYWWARRMFGTPTALVATFLLGTAGWPLIFGRVGWRAGLQPLFTTLTCLFFWRGLQTARMRDFAVSGAGVALTVNTYNGARSFPLLFPLFGVAYLIRNGRVMAQLRRYGLGVTIMLVSFAVCVAPLAWYAATHWIQFEGRADSLWAGPRGLLLNLKAGALLFNYWGNGDDFFVDTPLLEVPVAVLFVFGLLWCLLRVRDERAVFLLLGLAVGMVPGIVSRPNANRCIGVMPFAYVFAALGLLYFVRQLLRLGRVGSVLGLILLVLAGGAQARATFNEYLSHHRRRVWGFYPETTVLGRYMRTLGDRYSIVVGGANFPRDTLTFYTYPGTGDPMERRYTWVDDVTTLLREVPKPPRGRGLAVILATIDASPGVFAQLLERFPEREIVDLRYPVEGGPVFARALLVAPESVPQSLVAPPPTPPTGAVLWSGGRGYGLGQFNTPKGLARGKQGEFYVADTGNHRVQKFDATGNFIAAWGRFGSVAGSFREPSAIAVDDDGNVHVVDTWNHRVQKLTPEGTPLLMYGPPAGFFGPRGIAIAKDRIYVTDGGNNHVAVFDPKGTFISQFGEPGGAAGQLLLPIGVAVDRQGLIWVVDSGNNRLQAFRADGTSARIVPVPGWETDQIKEGYLASTDDGLILTDPTTGRLLLLRGNQLTVVPLDTPLAGPSGVVWDKTMLYVSERDRQAVARVPWKHG